MIAENLEEIRQSIAVAATHAGRNTDSVSLIAVSKTKPTSMVREAVTAGQVDFGENRPQELAEKHAELPDLRWHMIGSLQRNKVKYLVEFVHLIHSVDSERLLREIEKQASKVDRRIACLFQINISDEEQKGGFTEDEAEKLLMRLTDFPHIQVHGLMGMAAFTPDQEVVRGQFRRLRLAAERFRALENAQIEMKELSMGMSGDYKIAIEEGATLVRVGSAIFGGR